MQDLIDVIVEILLEILPDNDIWKVVLLILVIFTVTRYPWEWIGRVIQYAFRWMRCYLFKTHTYSMMTGTKNMYGQLMSGTKRCVVCGYVQHF